MDYDLRSGFIVVEDRTGAVREYHGLDFKFSGTKVGTQMSGNFTCAVCGLSKHTINRLCAWNSPEFISEERKIAVYAGYENGRTERIFVGQIIEAKPTQPPDIWVEFTCIPFIGDVNLVNIAISQEDYSPKFIFNEIAKALKLKIKYWNLKSENLPSLDKKRMWSYYYNGTLDGLLTNLADTFAVRVFVEDDVLVVTEERGWLSAVRDARTISSSTGMIGIPKVDIRGATIRVGLNDSYGVGSWIYLDSNMFWEADGYYYVIKKHHEGHLRGDNWYTELECIRHGAQV